MNFIGLMGSKTFKHILVGGAIISLLILIFVNVQRYLNNYTTEKINGVKKDNVIENIKLNQAVKEKQHKDDLKAQEFNIKVKSKKELIKKKVNIYKKENYVPTDNTVDKPIYFNL